ncbi:MAG: hypothetical protein IPP71_12045 [Bacteroidetes bacterium]|nr:hypothetical protein [Bacteroidota bacterium]
MIAHPVPFNPQIVKGVSTVTRNTWLSFLPTTSGAISHGGLSYPVKVH